MKKMDKIEKLGEVIQCIVCFDDDVKKMQFYGLHNEYIAYIGAQNLLQKIEDQFNVS